MVYIRKILMEFYYSFVFSWHNHKFLKNKVNESNSIIIVESNGLYASHLAYSYICSVLSKKYSCKIAIFKSTFFKNNLERILHLIVKKLNIFQYQIYSSFGGDLFLYYKQVNKNDGKYIKFYNSLKTKNDLLNFKIDGILYGDLIYDSYLRWHGEPTINLKNPHFKHFFLKSIDYYYFCSSLFSKYIIKSVILSHSVYLPAILGRIAIEKKGTFYCAGLGHLSKLTKNEYCNDNNIHNYRILLSMKKKDRLVGRNLAKKDFKSKIKGFGNVGVENLKIHPFAGKINKNIISNSKKIKILVASHCFFDSPHVFGNFLFDDFYEWLNFLGKISQKTDYEWYLKPHPNKIYVKQNKEILNKFVNKYKKFKLVDNDLSHFSFINKIDFVFSIHGTIGAELALFNIPVLNGSNNGRFSKYRFNINPRDIKKYEKIILNLKNYRKIKVNKNEVYDAHYINLLHYHSNTYVNFNKMSKDLGWKNITGINVIKYWLNIFNVSKHKKILSTISRFIDKSERSKSYMRLK